MDIGSFDRVRVNHSGINTKITWRRRVDGVYNVFNTSDFNDVKMLNSKSVAWQSHYVRKSSQNEETSLNRNLS